MTTNPVCIRLAPDCLLQGLQGEVMAAIQTVEGELDLDLAAVLRIDSAVARALEQLAAAADQRGIRVRLRRSNVDVYKALLLLGLVRRFTFSD